MVEKNMVYGSEHSMREEIEFSHPQLSCDNMAHREPCDREFTVEVDDCCGKSHISTMILKLPPLDGRRCY